MRVNIHDDPPPPKTYKALCSEHIINALKLEHNEIQ